MPPGSLPAAAAPAIRHPAVAGSFYPADPIRLRALVDALLRRAEEAPPAAASPAGLLVPHAGLVFSGAVAAAGWRLVRPDRSRATTVVLLGTNHSAGWLQGVGVWESGAWRTPLGEVAIDTDLAAAILGLGRPFVVDRAAHLGEHSVEVQLPLIQAAAPDSRIVPLAVATGTGPQAEAAGRALGALLAVRQTAGERLLLAVSSDMAHYPDTVACSAVTRRLLPPILELDPAALARLERAVVDGGEAGIRCGMCGIEPTVVGLAALRAMGATQGVALAQATSADAGGPADRTVGYLAVAFPSPMGPG